jgi:hypothetical protein
MIRFVYTDEDVDVTRIRDLDLLFEIFRLADKVQYKESMEIN